MTTSVWIWCPIRVCLRGYSIDFSRDRQRGDLHRRFYQRATKTKGGINSRFLYPTVALLDPELTLSLPPQATAQTGMDALTHAMEAYTSNKANPLSDMVAEKAITLIGQFLKKAVKRTGA